MIFQTIHIIWTVLLVMIFIGIVAWAWHDKSKKRFDDAANLPFADDNDYEDYKKKVIDDKLRPVELRHE